MSHSVTFDYVLENYVEIWESMCERTPALVDQLDDISDDPSIKLLLEDDITIEPGFYLDHLSLCLVLAETALGEAPTRWLIEKPPCSYIPTLDMVLKKVEFEGLGQYTVKESITVNIIYGLCFHLSPSNPSDILDVVLERLEVDSYLAHHFNETIEILPAIIH